MFAFTNHEAEAAVHTVQTGDTFWKVANQYGVSVVNLKSVNNQSSNMIYTGQKLVNPQRAISQSDKELLARLVSELRRKENHYAGKVAVATVVLNKTQSSGFP